MAVRRRQENQSSIASNLDRHHALKSPGRVRKKKWPKSDEFSSSCIKLATCNKTEGGFSLAGLTLAPANAAE